MQSGLFGVEFRLVDLSKNGDPLEKMNEFIPWEEFAPNYRCFAKEKPKAIEVVGHLMLF